ncbi:MAG TPA: Ig-like domain-containing protein [Candidatus Binatia bacterium]|nr:Ig-like domain-containing protein [Candidatus Binatia bacterium]
MRPIRTVAAFAAPFESLGKLLSSHRALARVSLAALSFTIVIAFSQQAAIQAGPEAARPVPQPLLPQSVGIAVAADGVVIIPFEVPMDPGSVESSIQVIPDRPLDFSWNEDHTAVNLAPERNWRTNEQYLVLVAASSLTADGAQLSGARRYAFTTESGPTINDFQVRLALADLPASKTPATGTGPTIRSVDAETEDRGAAAVEGALHPTTRTARAVSATSSIAISFSDEMDTSDVEAHFAISPEVAGELSWSERDLVFTPSERLEPGARYTISLIGSHDRLGNALGGKANFSFIVQPGSQLTRTSPGLGARGVEPASVEMWFSAPMDVDDTNAAFGLTDTSTGTLVAGRLDWNEARTRLTYVPDQAFAGGRNFKVELGEGARDADGNAVASSWSFTTLAAPVSAPTPQAAAGAAPAPRTVPAAGPASSLVGYALNQINAARAAYGFAPIYLDGAISAVANAHAWDQVNFGYYSHYSRNGMSVHQRLAAAGIGYSAAGENQCHYYGRSADATLNWCHAVFMAEPYPGYRNHIANILNPRWTRVGIGIADNGSRVVITWDFAN